eukprot:762521-Hanusia_phi.AAC.13
MRGGSCPGQARLRGYRNQIEQRRRQHPQPCYLSTGGRRSRRRRGGGGSEGQTRRKGRTNEEEGKEGNENTSHSLCCMSGRRFAPEELRLSQDFFNLTN